MRFAEILESKIQEQTDVESSFPSAGQKASEKFPSHFSPEPLHIRLAREGLSPLLHPKKSGSYTSSPRPKPQGPTPTTKQAVPQPQERIYLVSDLSPSERDGLQFFILNGAMGLSHDFSASKLKREYRRLARQIHPDHSFHKGSDAAATTSGKFQLLQEARQNLSRFLK